MFHYVDIRYLCFMTLACTVTVIDNIMIFCKDVNKTSTSVKLLAINVIKNKEVG